MTMAFSLRKRPWQGRKARKEERQGRKEGKKARKERRKEGTEGRKAYKEGRKEGRKTAMKPCWGWGRVHNVQRTAGQ